MNEYSSFRDHFSQATLFWISPSEAEKQHSVDAFHFELGEVDSKELRQRIAERTKESITASSRRERRGSG